MAIGVVVLCYLAYRLPPVPRAKTQALRVQVVHGVQGVNTVRFAASAALTNTNTNAPATLPSPGQ